MKVYLHLEGERSFTRAQNVSESTSVQDLLEEFAASFNLSARDAQLDASGLTLKDSDGKILVDSKKSLSSRFAAGDDLFVFSSCGAKASIQVVPTTSVKDSANIGVDDDAEEQSREGATSPTKSSKANKSRAKSKARAKAKSSAVVGISTEQRNDLENYMKAKTYKRARELAENILKETNNKDPISLRVLGDLFYQTKSYTKAVDICKVALTVLPQSVQVHYNFAKSLMALKRFSEAADKVKIALHLQANLSLQDEPAHMRTEAFKMELIALFAECLFALGQHNEAVALINDVTANPASAASVPILTAYSSFALHYNKYEEPTRALLKAVIMGEHPRVRAQLAKLMSCDAGMAEILRQVPPSLKASDADRKGKGEVYAFLGYVGKCHSAIKASLRFYHMALQMTPASASCALNLVHVYEIAADYESAMQVAVDFFQANLSLGVGVDAAASTRKGAVSPVSLRCRDMLALLNSDSAQDDIADSVHPPFTWVALEETYGYVQFPTPTATEGESSSALRKVKVMYSNAELDLLALFATVVKVLFLQGRLHLLPGLYRVLEPCRMQSEKSLHETTIRNEMAYLQEIAQLLCYRAAHASYGLSELGTSSSASQAGLYNLSPLLDVSRSSKPAVKPSSSSSSSSSCVPSSSSGPRSAWTTTESAPITEVPSVLRAAAQRPIYVLGDSHSVSPAWSVLSVRGEARLLVPRLATGVKHWHLRAESDFYPRAHFQNMVASIPPGSEVFPFSFVIFKTSALFRSYAPQRHPTILVIAGYFEHRRD